MAARMFLPLLLAAAVNGIAASAVAGEGAVFQTTVTPTPEEDLATPCHYELTLPDRSQPVTVVWVIFDRGRDMRRYYEDADITEFARRRQWALLLPFHCAAKSLTAPSEQGDTSIPIPSAARAERSCQP